MQSSTYTVDPTPQKDGRVYVREAHIDDAGIAREFNYLAASNADFPLLMAQHAAIIDAQLAEAEFNEVLNGA